MRAFRKGLLTIVLTIAGLSAASAQSLETVTVQEGSKLWIEGASTVNEWTCAASSLQGVAAVGVADVAEVRQSVEPHAHLSVPVNSFDCGRDRMNADFARALKASEHPRIQYELTEAVVLDEEETVDGWLTLLVRGELSIAGRSRAVETVAHGRRLANGHFQVRGSTDLTMTSFGIRPPVALLGLVKAHDDIEVHFDLLAASESIVAR